MKRKIFIISFLFVAFGIGIYLVPKSEVIEPSLAIKAPLLRTQPQVETQSPQLNLIKKDDNPVPTKRSPAQAAPTLANFKFKKLRADRIEVEFQLDENHFIAKNVRAVLSKDYDPSQGPLLYQGTSHSFFHSTDPHAPGQLSVYHSEMQRLFPLSSIIRLTNTDEFKREEIISRGYREHLYLESLNLLFIATNTSDYSVVYQKLLKEGFLPEFQINDRVLVPR